MFVHFLLKKPVGAINGQSYATGKERWPHLEITKKLYAYILVLVAASK